MKAIFTTLVILTLTACATTEQRKAPQAIMAFNEKVQDPSLCAFVFEDPTLDSALLLLKEKYQLEEKISASTSAMNSALLLLDWTHNQWKHNGSNTPKKSDALSILKEAEEGKQFRCVEYGVVLSAALTAVGMPTRTLGLKTKQVETTKYGAGHVVSEAYIPSLGKWVFLDAQMNYVPFLNGMPLNAVEYKMAILNQEQVALHNKNGVLEAQKAKKYMEWVAPYLYYFDARMDNTRNGALCKGKSRLMLVPLGAKEPTIFQIEYPIDYCLYTNNTKDFYRVPLTP